MISSACGLRQVRGIVSCASRRLLVISQCRPGSDCQPISKALRAFAASNFGLRACTGSENDFLFGAIRARTRTSADMLRVMLNELAVQEYSFLRHAARSGLG